MWLRSGDCLWVGQTGRPRGGTRSKPGWPAFEHGVSALRPGSERPIVRVIQPCARRGAGGASPRFVKSGWAMVASAQAAAIIVMSSGSDTFLSVVSENDCGWLRSTADKLLFFIVVAFGVRTTSDVGFA